MAAKFPQSLEDQFTCPICLDQYQDPRMLPCQHTYCKSCLETLLCSGNSYFFTQKSIQCPECRETVQVDVVSSLPVNIWASKTLSLIEQSKAEKQSTTVLKCKNCGSKEPAKARCLNCETFVCDDCIAEHQLLLELANHQIMTLEEIENKGIPFMEQTALCDIHKGKKQLMLFCGNCEIPFCKDCSFIDHKDHVFFITKITYQSEKNLRKKITAVGVAQKEIESALKKVKDMQKRVKRNIESVHQKIDDTINTKLQTLEELRQRLKEKSDKTMELKMKRLSAQQDDLEMHLSALKRASDFSENILEKGSNSDFLEMAEQVLSRLSDMPGKDNKVEDEDKQDLQVDEATPCGDMVNFVKVIDRAVPDPGMCEVGWYDTTTIRLKVRNFKGEPVNIKTKRVQINCPFPYTVIGQSQDGGFIIQGSFMHPQQYEMCTGNLDFSIDGYPVKGSPLQVCQAKDVIS